MTKEIFEKRLADGRLGEDLISRWFRSFGWNVVPAYETSIDSGKGPRFFAASGDNIVSPDLLIFQGREFRWIEAKHKSAFTWYRINESWQTGIDRRHWNEYLKVREQSKLPVYLFFLHEPGHVAKDTPDGMISPSGLYGESIDVLKDKIDHESALHGPSGMVYWKEQDLKKYAEYAMILERLKCLSCAYHKVDPRACGMCADVFCKNQKSPVAETQDCDILPAE